MRALLAGLLLALTVLTGCTGGDGEAQRSADRVAAALSEGRLAAELFGGRSPQAAYDDVVGGLGDVSPEVSAGTVDEEDDTATVALTWRWDLRGHEWRYTTRAVLDRTGETWRAAWDPAIVEPTLREGETLDRSTLLARRGDILGARGSRIVTDRTVLRFGIDKTRVAPPRAAASARRLAAIVGVDPAGFVTAVRAAGAEAFVEAIALRPEDATALDPSYDQVAGVSVIKEKTPLAPTRDFAAAVLGRVGAATAELVEQSDGRIQPGDVVGLSGLQARYDEELAGTPGVTVEAVTQEQDEEERRTLFTAEPVHGRPLRTTLDPSLQTKAERMLAVPDPDSPGPATAIVAIRPSTGAVLAAANGAGADGQNVATYGQSAPGSTFKVISSLALLRSGLAPDSPVQCPPALTVDGKRFENYDDYPAGELGTISLREAVAHSCNTAFIGQRKRLTPEALTDAAESLGLGVDFDLGFPAYFGQVPEPRSDTEAAADLIGQGTVLASPLVMAAVTASVAAGRTVVPHLLVDQAPEADPATPLRQGEAAALRTLMRAVVTEGSGSVLAALPGEIGAKTGTAEYGADGQTHAWMVAFRGDLAVAVFVETGESGSSTAGPLLRSFLQ